MSEPAASFDEIVETFELLGGDWEEKYRYLIGLGRKLTPLSDQEKCEANLVRGCQSQVWLIPEITGDGKFQFRGESDASIVSGLISVILALHWNKSADEIIKIDAQKELGKLQLENHLTASRRNGLFAMAEKIKTWAVEHSA
ncbi:MAG: SufE family protein [Verrucomicrobiales bacterium]|nr:SufE family protein [Verrucomicrobiales bacterium]